VAYKKDVDDLRESPSLKIMQLLQQRGALLRLQRPLFPATAQDAALQLRKHEIRAAHFRTRSEAMTPSLSPRNHSTYDYAAIADCRKAGH